MMVLRYDDSNFLLVLQIDHSRVAGYLASHWGNSVFAEPRPYTSVVLAAQEHDNGWWEWEVKPSLNDQGYPLDYHDGSLKYLGKFRLDFYRDGVDNVIKQDPYAGLLVLMHGVGLMNAGYGRYTYPPDRSANPLVQEYIRDQEALRLKLLDNLRQSEELQEFLTDEQIWKNFELIEVFDQLAQFLCNRYPLNSRARRYGPSNTLNDVSVSVGPGKSDVILTIDVLDEKRAIVRPYPFDRSPLEVSFPGRLLPIKRYENREDFLRDFYKAERLTITYRLQTA